MSQIFKIGILLFLLIIVQYTFPSANAQGVVSWNRPTYLPNSEGLVEIADRDLSLNPLTITTFQTSVYSDSDLSGIKLEMVETAPDSGIFLGAVYFSTNYPSSGNRLHVSDGDTVTAEYIDRTLPPPYLDTQQLILTATASIASNSSDYSTVCGYILNGNLMYGPKSCPTIGVPTILSQAKNLPSDVLAYLANTDEDYYHLLIAQHKCLQCNSDVSKLCTYDQNGNLLPSFTEEQRRVLLDLQANFSFSICPFTTNSTILQSNTTIINNTSSEDPLKQFKSGISADDVKCRQDQRLVIKAENNTPACVYPDTAAKLLDRGWAKNPM